MYKNIIGLLKEVVYIKKWFFLNNTFNPEKGKNTIDDLNRLLDSVGVSFSVLVEERSKKLFIEVDEKN